MSVDNKDMAMIMKNGEIVDIFESLKNLFKKSLFVKSKMKLLL